MQPEAHPVSRETEEKLGIYHALLLKWQKTINLVSPATLDQAEVRHFRDSTQILPLLPPPTKILYDLGSGAGFPGLVIAIARPDIQVHLMESDQRKCQFLRTVSRETDIPVTIHTSRIESVDISAPDVITARALASLEVLLGLTQKWWVQNPNLTLIFPKGERADEEINAACKTYKFDLKAVPSKTDSNAKILQLQNVRLL